MALTLDLWKGLQPMPVTATLKLVLRDLPETREKDGLVYMALQNEPRGTPQRHQPGQWPALPHFTREAVAHGLYQSRADTRHRTASAADSRGACLDQGRRTGRCGEGHTGCGGEGGRTATGVAGGGPPLASRGSQGTSWAGSRSAAILSPAGFLRPSRRRCSRQVGGFPVCRWLELVGPGSAT